MLNHIHSFSPHQRGLGGGVSEGVDLPADAGRDVELAPQEAVPQGGLVDHAGVVGGGLVVHAPPAVAEPLQPLLTCFGIT